MSGRFPVWRAAVRLGRRDVLRAPGRNALVVTMVGVPVLLVVALTVFLRTYHVSAAEALPRQLGAADALIAPVARTPVVQRPDDLTAAPEDPRDSEATGRPWSAAEVAAAAGGRVLPIHDGAAAIRTARGAIGVRVRQVDLRDPLSNGLVDIVAGRPATTAAEVAVTPVLADRGLGIGSSVTLADSDAPASVVGIVTDPTAQRRPGLFALPGSPLADRDPAGWSYLLDTDQPVTWAEVRRLNNLGLAVLSRAVVLDPPPAADLPPQQPGLPDQGYPGLLGTAVASVTLEVALLAGPAFAVGVHRRRRELALLAATGGSPADLRRTVLAQALVLGAGTAIGAAVLGVGLARAAVWVMAGRVPRAFGPFQIGSTDVVATVLVGTAAALLAAWLPARQAARTDVVAALTGRRAHTRSRRGWPLAGAVLAATGATLCLTLGTHSRQTIPILAARLDSIAVVAGLLLLVTGAILATPALIGLAGRLARPLPLPLRFAARDAARNRGRTAPAVAAVMAAVAGITTLSVLNASVFASARDSYTPQLPHGFATVQGVYGQPQLARRIAATIRGELPGRPVLQPHRPTAFGNGRAGRLLPPGCDATAAQTCRVLDARPPDGPPHHKWWHDLLVADAATVEGLTGRRLTAPQRRLLDTGGVLLASQSPLRDGHTAIASYTVTARDRDTFHAMNLRLHRLPAAVLDGATPHGADTMGLAAAVIGPTTASTLGIDTVPEIVIPPTPGPLSPHEQQRLEEALRGITPHASIYVERGFTETLTTPFLVLALVGALLVLVGTLTAAGLALVDAAPDLATLGAVGAAPHTRRGIAAGQALVIGLLGATLGVAVGTVPGLSAGWQITAGPDGQHPTLAVPWTLLALIVLATPGIAALCNALATRSRPTLTRRLAG